MGNSLEVQNYTFELVGERIGKPEDMLQCIRLENRKMSEEKGTEPGTNVTQHSA